MEMSRGDAAAATWLCRGAPDRPKSINGYPVSRPSAPTSTSPRRYGWEARTAPGAARRRRVETGAGVFAATDLPGVYSAPDDEGVDAPEGRAYVDLQVVLSAAERDEVRRLRKKIDGVAQKEKRLAVDAHKRKEFLNSQLPYVDARRVEAAIYRPAVGKGGARWNI